MYYGDERLNEKRKGKSPLAQAQQMWARLSQPQKLGAGILASALVRNECSLLHA